MRIAGYGRVSTDEQVNEGYSLDAQREKMINFCKSQNDWELTEIYIEEGKSAKNLDRPELQRLLSDAQSGKFDVVLVYRLDRLTRSVSDLYELLRLFEEQSIKFKSVTEVYDTTTAMGKLFITIVAALAQWERENLSERVRFGMEELVREGKWHGGPVPYGYSWDNEMMSLVSDEVSTLKLLRQIYMSGDGLGSTAKKLNALGKLRRGKVWSSQSVWYTLDNPFYAGKFRYGEKKKNGKYASRKKEELVNVIWADSGFPLVYTWEEYQEHRERMKIKEFVGYSKKREYRFTGVLRCARCGATLIGRPYKYNKVDGTKTEPVYNYVCANKSLSKGCTMPLLKQSIAEKLIMEYISQISISQSRIDEIADTSERDKVNVTEIDKLNKELRNVADRRKKWQYMFVEGLISADDLRERKKEEEDNERIINERLSEIKADCAGVKQSTLNKLLSLPELWSVLSDTDKRELMQTVFKRVVIECEVESGRKHARKGKTLPFVIKDVEYN